MFDVVMYALLAAAVIFATARGLQRREYGWLLRYYALVVIAFGGMALQRAVPFEWGDEVFIAMLACFVVLAVADFRYRRAA